MVFVLNSIQKWTLCTNRLERSHTLSQHQVRNTIKKKRKKKYLLVLLMFHNHLRDHDLHLSKP